jgi:hypothetical protein
MNQNATTRAEQFHITIKTLRNHCNVNAKNAMCRCVGALCTMMMMMRYDSIKTTKSYVSMEIHSQLDDLLGACSLSLSFVMLL